jgi:hypothetical protein
MSKLSGDLMGDFSNDGEGFLDPLSGYVQMGHGPQTGLT